MPASGVTDRQRGQMPPVLLAIERSNEALFVVVVCNHDFRGTSPAVKFIDAGQLASKEDVVEIAKAVPGTLVVMTTHAHTGIARVVLGSVTGSVVRRSGSPILVLQPAVVSKVKERADDKTRQKAKVGKGLASQPHYQWRGRELIPDWQVHTQVG